MTPCHSACTCGWPGPAYGPHDPDCRALRGCDERYCDRHMAEAEAEHAYLRGKKRYEVTGDTSDPEYIADMRDAGRGHLLGEAS